MPAGVGLPHQGPCVLQAAPERLWLAHHGILGGQLRSYRANPNASDAEAVRGLEAYVAQFDGDILSEDMVGTLTTGKRIYVEPFGFSQLWEQGLWSLDPLLEHVRDGYFSVVVLRFRLDGDTFGHHRRIEQPMIDALRERYFLKRVYSGSTVGDYFVYLRK